MAAHLFFPQFEAQFPDSYRHQHITGQDTMYIHLGCFLRLYKDGICR